MAGASLARAIGVQRGGGHGRRPGRPKKKSKKASAGRHMKKQEIEEGDDDSEEGDEDSEEQN